MGGTSTNNTTPATASTFHRVSPATHTSCTNHIIAPHHTTVLCSLACIAMVSLHGQ